MYTSDLRVYPIRNNPETTSKIQFYVPTIIRIECTHRPASLTRSNQKSVRPKQLFQDKRGMLYT